MDALEEAKEYIRKWCDCDSGKSSVMSEMTVKIMRGLIKQYERERERNLYIGGLMFGFSLSLIVALVVAIFFITR